MRTDLLHYASQIQQVVSDLEDSRERYVEVVLNYKEILCPALKQYRKELGEAKSVTKIKLEDDNILLANTDKEITNITETLSLLNWDV